MLIAKEEVTLHRKSREWLFQPATGKTSGWIGNPREFEAPRALKFYSVIKVTLVKNARFLLIMRTVEHSGYFDVVIHLHGKKVGTGAKITNFNVLKDGGSLKFLNRAGALK